jgi:hypothetical protein
MLRIFSVVRKCSSNIPKPIESLKKKEQDVLQEIHDEKLEKDKAHWEILFPDPDKIAIKKEIPEYPSAFGPSDDEETPAYFIEDLSSFQYIYTPKNSISFDQDGLALVYKAKKTNFLLPYKLTHCWKIVFPVLFSIGVTMQPSHHTTPSILLSWCIPLAILTRALIVDKIYLCKDGKTAKFVYKRFKFLPKREKIINLNKFKEPKGDSFFIWSVYEFPDDLKTFNENPNVSRISFAKYISWWSFFLLPKNPAEINREVLINILNGIYIDTTQTGGEDLKSRYYIFEPKHK